MENGTVLHYLCSARRLGGIGGGYPEVSRRFQVRPLIFTFFFCIDTHVEDDWGQTGQHLAVDLGNAELVAAFSNKEDDDDDEKDDEDMVCCMYNFVFTDKLQSFGQEINKTKMISDRGSSWKI